MWLGCLTLRGAVFWILWSICVRRNEVETFRGCTALGHNFWKVRHERVEGQVWDKWEKGKVIADNARYFKVRIKTGLVAQVHYLSGPHTTSYGSVEYKQLSASATSKSPNTVKIFVICELFMRGNYYHASTKTKDWDRTAMKSAKSPRQSACLCPDNREGDRRDDGVGVLDKYPSCIIIGPVSFPKNCFLLPWSTGLLVLINFGSSTGAMLPLQLAPVPLCLP
ncbi:hypothetical protein EV421DRAFT_1739666 [Armillaria borealis]|uniref:Uncharacterized protein n=1 Tax=Armillaria borealis TaxID=47425 RepID=A0AA39J673_9AGAR|nr:hypothetical protein EV421DRAFT_1739666 [Armillaria borealis]